MESDAGWTFVETLIVMGIVLILTSTVGIVGFRYLERAKLVAARTTIETLSIAVESYYLDCGRYPTNEQGLEALREKPVLEPVPQKWKGPYLSKRITVDPWGTPYHYRVPGPNGLPYAVLSFAADGAEGGDGDAADIASWRE